MLKVEQTRMRTELFNGRRCASVEKFTEMVLNQPIPIVDDEERDEDELKRRSVAYVPPRDFEQQTLFPSTSIPVSQNQQQRLSAQSSSIPSSTVFGTVFTKQSPAQRPNFTPNNNNRSSGRGVQQKMRSNGHPPTTQHQRPTTSTGVLKQEAMYKPDRESLASSVPTQKTYEKLAEVYSSSDDTVQFAGNLRTFLSERIHYGVWIGFAVIELLLGLVFLFVGALNLPMCEIQPLIPVYLLASGVVLLIHGIVRIFASIPSPAPSRRQQRSNRSKLHKTLCLYAIEGIVLLAMIIVVILGCVWVYGARYVHFHEGIFEEDYCDGFVYWCAWWSVTIHLVVLSLFILGLIFILIYGSLVTN